MYLITGKNKCTQCNILKNLLDEKGVKYSYLDKEELPQTTTQYFKNVHELSNYIKNIAFQLSPRLY